MSAESAVTDAPAMNHGANPDMPRVYLDQNILSHVRAGRFNPAAVKGVKWIYSNEHFNEISRGEDLSFLDDLDRINACQIELILDDQFRFTGEARFQEPGSVTEKYGRYLQSKAEVPVDDTIFTELLLRVCGADNEEKFNSIPARFIDQMQVLLGKSGIDDSSSEVILEGCAEIAHELVTSLSEATPIEKTRKALIGTKCGPATTTDNPLLEIEQAVKSRMPEVDIKQFFGIEPPDKQGYEQWPTYLAIISCHMMLNLLGYQADKEIRKPDGLLRAMSDAAHIGHAAYCHTVLSEDARFCAKAKAIYKYLNIPTVVLQLQVNR